MGSRVPPWPPCHPRQRQPGNSLAGLPVASTVSQPGRPGSGTATAGKKIPHAGRQQGGKGGPSPGHQPRGPEAFRGLCTSQRCQELQQLRHSHTGTAPAPATPQPPQHGPGHPMLSPTPSWTLRRGGDVPAGLGAGGTQDPRWRAEERVKREAKPLPPHRCQTAAWSQALGPKSLQRVTRVTSMPGLSTTTPTAPGGCKLGGWAPLGLGRGGSKGCSPPPQTALHPRAERGADGNVLGRWKPFLLPANGARAGGGGAPAPGGGHSGHGRSGPQVSGLGAGSGVPKAALPGKGGGLQPPRPCPSLRLWEGGGCTPLPPQLCRTAAP